MAKPASSRCNLDCRYCVYRDKPTQPVMDDATLEAFIRQHIAAQPGADVQFAWQGGEPTLCGLDFFERVVALQKQYGAGKRIQNAFQTNGMLLNDAWCQFLHNNGWLVGVSLDGPADLHDAHRSGKPTHHKAIEAIAKLVEHRVDFNLVVVVNRLNSQQPARLYRYLRQLGTPFLQFIPLVERDEKGAFTAGSVEPQAWGEFLNAVFDIWVREDMGRVFVQLFDSTLSVWSGHPSQTCARSVACVCAECQGCSLLRFCQGDCPKHRDSSGKSVICSGYKAFFNHTAPHMRVMRDLLKQHRSPIELMMMLR